MALSWLVCDFTTGTVLSDFADMTLGGAPLRQTIGQYEQAALSFPVSTAPGEWLQFTTPYTANLIALDESGTPVWGGPITKRTRDETDTVGLGVASGEAWLDRRYISPAVSSTVITTPTYGYYASYDQCALAADLVTRYAQAGTRPGMPVRIVAGTSAQPGRTHIYSDADDKTLYSGLQDLMGILNGPEWTLTWEWQHNPERITPVFTVADRIGISPPAGFGPAAQFTLPGCVLNISVVEDYSNGKGANDITAVGPGQGNSRPAFRQVATNFGGRPTIEYRFNVPSTGQLTTAQIAALQGYANNALFFMGNGAQQVTLTSNIDTAPKLGVDWNVGDDIGYQIGGYDQNGADIAASFPGGLVGTARSIGVERTDTTLAPIIFVPNPTLTAGSF